jgi:transcriptional antiterminator NusG
MNLKGQVKKIDLHRRIAKVEVSFMGAQTILHLGIDLVERAGAE